ncbi:ankyrin, partial [Dissoconium aciculare CBS 342.82]|uniref:Ankyrin n=1 Tax=Dissoconium aciculare CBS 342.82 TaxID=1314786 RepID=A0A6J3MEA0_9PEZI
MPLIQRLLRDVPQLRMIATSRDYPEIRDRMEEMRVVSMPLEAQAVDSDIRIYVLTQLAEDRMLRRLDNSTKKLIEDTIVKKADAMLTKQKLIRAALLALPDTLDEMYVRILTAILERDRSDAFDLLQWISYARRPLTLLELSETTMIHWSIEAAGEGGVDATDRNDTSNPQKQVHAYEGATVRLAHFSVQEFLESARILTSNAKPFHLDRDQGHQALTHSCLLYIQYYIDSPEKCVNRSDLEEFPLLEYTCSNWYHHANSQKTEEATARIVSFLTSEHSRHVWLCVHQPDNFNIFIPNFAESVGFGSALYYASYMGLESVVRKLLQTGADVTASQGGSHDFPLQAAAAAGHQGTVQILIDNGADINAQDCFSRNALIDAARNGHAEVVSLLLGHRAD